jgi:hypothetical protein
MQNDHGPPSGTRDRPSDTGSAARLAARPATEIMLFRPVDVQCTSRRLRLANPNPEWHLQAAKQAAPGICPRPQGGGSAAARIGLLRVPTAHPLGRPHRPRSRPLQGSAAARIGLLRVPTAHPLGRPHRPRSRPLQGSAPARRAGDLPRPGSGSCESRLRTHSEGRTGREAGRFRDLPPPAGRGICRGEDRAPADPRFAENYSALRYFSFSHSETWMRYSSHSRRLSSM